MPPLVSIVVPSYNYNRLTELLIKSVMNQTYNNWQCVIVDDCSTDDTPDILRKYCGIDNRLEIIFNHKNLGMAKTLNKGFIRARGEYIIGMNADDCLAESDALSKLVSFMDANPDIGLVYTDNWVIDKEGNKIEIFRKVTSDGDALMTSDFIATWSCMWRDSVFQKINRRVEFDMCCDWDLWLKLTEHCKIAHLPEPLFGWYKHSDSLYFRRRREGVLHELQCLLNARRRRGVSNLTIDGLILVVRLYKARRDLWVHRLREARLRLSRLCYRI